MIKALFFDVFGTVVDWRNSIAVEFDRLAKEKGLDLDGQAFALAWRRRYVPAMKVVRSGERGFVALDTLHRENLIEVLEEFGIDGLSETEIDELNRAWHRLAPWPDSVPGLTRLKKKFILATMSNGNVALMINMAKHGGLPWDMILGAELAGTYKPEPETYLTGCRLLHLAPEDCMMVAAHNGDLVAARDLGLKTAFIARPTEYGPEQKVDFEAEHDYDVIADSMEGVADQLGC
ncbi:haloacid dehalogenase type II [Nisaea acidiphila]|uniref:Haloacid dehalogenase type II n=1 Tax=Nisaea acidiphila TaxID=1862145 RepID=A0A9J7B025_9PROT|nr:haloacid dehalogenase type II [Nisaea acidiphila]UUX51045.1 haloacid dehalogenase type II [Nisaea acidiphila]